MTLRDDVLAAKPSRTCLYQKVRAKLTAKDRTDLDEMIVDDSIPAAAIRGGLRLRGLALSDETLRKHRLKKCALCH